MSTRWSGRPGMASCASARLAEVVTVAIVSFVAVMAVCAASESIAEGVVRASLCVEASERALYSLIFFGEGKYSTFTLGRTPTHLANTSRSPPPIQPPHPCEQQPPAHPRRRCWRGVLVIQRVHVDDLVVFVDAHYLDHDYRDDPGDDEEKQG